jgi:serine/threonine protein kinase
MNKSSGRPPRLHRTSSANGAGAGSPRPSFGLLLAARSSGSSRASSELSEEILGPTFGLKAGEKLDTEGIAGRPIFIIRDAEGNPTGVRKIATVTDVRPGQFAATIKEAVVYKTLSEKPNWRQHIIPFRFEKIDDKIVIIDFDWIEGEDIEKYIQANPETAVTMIKEITQQLQWLASVGHIHGDIKLDNFYHTTDGRVLMFDFGRSSPLRLLVLQTELFGYANMIEPFSKPAAAYVRAHALPEDYSVPFAAHIISVYTEALKFFD